MSLLTIILFVVGVALLIFGAEILVRGASGLAFAVGISPLVVGLTVVAFGTSAPELAVGIQAAATGQSDIALGNVVGSNIANILLILGLSAMAAPLIVSPQILRFDLPLMMVVSVVVYAMAWNGLIGFVEGLILMIGIISYTAWTIYKSRRDEKDASEASAAAPDHVAPWYIDLGLLLLGLVMLVLGARWIVNGASDFARSLGVSELIIGLTIVAVGTSLPEIAISVVASIRGERDIAVGNAVGSNIFNILSVLGVTALVAPAGIPIPAEALRFDMLVMLVVSLALLPVCYTQREISRWEGVLFTLYYVVYTAYLVLIAMQSTVLNLFNGLLVVAVPLTVIVLFVLMIYSMMREGRRIA